MSIRRKLEKMAIGKFVQIYQIIALARFLCLTRVT